MAVPHTAADTPAPAPKNGRGRRAGMAAIALSTLLGVALVAPTAANAEPAVRPSVSSAIGDDPLVPTAVEALAQLQAGSRGSRTAMNRYVVLRNDIADEVALRLEMPATALRWAWARADTEHQLALMAAFTQLGVPYRNRGVTAGVGFDCSGFTGFAWSVAGVDLPRSSSAQIRDAEKRTLATAQAGDILWYPGHAMMYLGVERAMVHSPQSGRSVEVDLLNARRSPRYGDPTE